MKTLVILFSIAVSDGLIFDCYFYFGSWPFAGNIYTCRPEVIFMGQQATLELVWGDHLDGFSDSSVKALNIENIRLNLVPKDITKFFPNLIVLRWMNADLDDIFANDLQPFPSLVALIVHQNLLTSLDGDLLRYTQLLEYIDLSENAIENVGSDLLTSLTYLKEVNLLDNVCINAQAVTPQAISILKLQLPIYCAQAGATSVLPDTTSTSVEVTSTLSEVTSTLSSTTETSNECNADCLERIRFLEEENNSQAMKILQLEAEIERIKGICLIPIEWSYREPVIPNQLATKMKVADFF